MTKIAIIGAGAWGTGLAIVLARKNRGDILLWAREQEIVDAILTERVNRLFLPSQSMPENVVPTTNLAEAVQSAEMVVGVVPSQHCRAIFSAASPHLSDGISLVSATKGLENNSLLRMTEVIRESTHANERQLKVAALSGPSFALEVARGDPTAVTAASDSAEVSAAVQTTFTDSRFRVYTSNDVIGVELGGALKNVIAIAAGVCDGLGLGNNSIAALITRGLAEMTRLVVACGGRAETMSGLAGLGDLVLTCTGGLSRNRSVGAELGRGRKLEDIIAGMHGAVAEGVFTTNAAIGLALKHNVEMPITQQMFAILKDGKSPADAMQTLMSRNTRGEAEPR
jgi:glycerol-3-phosphate dehydrogenase (NAD(P)+)